MHNQFNEKCKILKKKSFMRMQKWQNGYNLKASVTLKTVVL